MNLSLLWTAVGSVAGVAAVGVAGWQVRLAIADHRLRREAAVQRAEQAEQVERAEPATGDVARRPEASGQSVRLLPRPVFLTGREELLGELDSVFADGDGPQVAVLHGLGGCGKTSTALEYAYRHLGGFGIVWQFAAEEPTALAAGFGELAAQLGLRRMLDAGDPVAQVHSALASFPARWLLLFDNAPNRSAVEAVLPPAGHGCVLVTSQDPAWPGSHRLEVQVLDTEIAAVFLQSRTGDGDLAAARELATELGGLPLALAQAAAYMETCGYGIAEYLELFREERAGLLARGEAAGHAEQVAGTWQLAFDRLSEDTPQAIALLRLLACCAPEQIPVRTLLRSGADPGSLPPDLVPLLDSPLAVDDALAALRRYSLIGPPQDGMVSVHRLVQSVTLDSLPSGQADAWRQAARAIVSAALPSDPDLPDTWPAYSVLLPHAEVALPLTEDGMTQIARFLGESGDLAAARHLSGRLATARESALGASHPETLSARHHLARWTGETDPDAGRDQYAALLPIRERVLGPEDPATLTTRVNLARYTGRAGGFAAARDQLAALLPACERVLGTEHPDTLLARHDLARWTGLAGDVVAARDQLAALLPVHERVLGAEHFDTIVTRGSLADFAGQTGDAVAARDQFAALLPVSERAFGPEHPLTLEVRTMLARWVGESGGAAQARDQLTALLPVIERVGLELPVDHLARFQLAHWTGEAGDAKAARDRLAALLPVSERLYGGEHHDTLLVRHDLARWTGEAGDAVAARDQLAALLPIYEHILGPEHFETLKARASLDDWTRQAASIGSR